MATVEDNGLPREQVVGQSSPGRIVEKVSPMAGKTSARTIEGVSVITADDIDLNLGKGLKYAIRFFSHSSKGGIDTLDPILACGKLEPQPGGFPEVYLYNPCDHPGHPDYAVDSTQGKAIANPLLFVFHQRVLELPELERQEYEGFHQGYMPIRTDWEIKAKEVPFTHGAHGKMLSFLVVKEEEVERACQSLAKHDLKQYGVMPLTEWEKIKSRYSDNYHAALGGK